METELIATNPNITESNRIESDSSETLPTESNASDTTASETNAKKSKEKIFKLAFVLAENEVKIINETNLIKLLVEKFNANASLDDGITLKFLNVTGNVQHRKDILENIKKIVNVKKVGDKLHLLFHKIQRDFPLIEEIRYLNDPFSLYKTYTSLIAEKSSNNHEVTRVIRQMNAFRRLHCLEFTDETLKTLNILRDLYIAKKREMSGNMYYIANNAWKDFFNNIQNNEFDKLIDEFNSKTFDNNQKLQQLPKLVLNEDLKPKEKKIPLEEDQALFEYVKKLFKATQEKKLKRMLEKCMKLYKVKKCYSKEKRQAIKSVGEKLHMPFQST
ncbi:uncharacterized protein LOC123291010 [Chrysoperla carnea]|uniref:uncharacterized protein LOC123291010 n=1 Tax=Chrysoperla carnea TaxID=189513 RepID=UPI001D08A117|nr:uncharacterized protein LOC123291010 [Chrysoperla carnea]